MTNSQMFKLAHELTKEDIKYERNCSSTRMALPYSYYFRLHLLSVQAERKINQPGFQIIEPKRLWA
jgi:hypothetical protein